MNISRDFYICERLAHVYFPNRLFSCKLFRHAFHCDVSSFFNLSSSECFSVLICSSNNFSSFSFEEAFFFVMVSHLSVPAVTGDETPADLSEKIISELLRNKLGFENVIITDAQNMASITDHYTPAEAAVGALKAGADMILMPADLKAAHDGVAAAVKDGTLTEARLNESVLRILTVKAEYGIIS